MNQTKNENVNIYELMTPEDLEVLFNYPSLNKLFDVKNPHILEKFKQNLTRTKQDLERVVRQGSREDAEKAQKVIKALQVTEELLKNLESLKKENS